MPYIDEQSKADLGLAYGKIKTVGDLTYGLTRMANAFARGQGQLRFVTIALVMGAFFCAALEFYRRIAVPYENAKLAENGDVYDGN